jgi:hypothetical protein
MNINPIPNINPIRAMSLHVTIYSINSCFVNNDQEKNNQYCNSFPHINIVEANRTEENPSVYEKTITD